MPTREELERLSALLSGDLPAAEAQALERELAARPELRAARDRLRALDALLLAPLPPAPSPDPALLRAIAQVARRRRVGRGLAGLAGLAALAAAALLVWTHQPAPQRPEPVVAARPVPPADGVRWILTQGTEAALDGNHATFTSGTLLGIGKGTLVADGQTYEFDGSFVATTEPSVAASRVFQSLANEPSVPGENMIGRVKAQWLKATVVSAAGAAVMLTVLDGQAAAQPPAPAMPAPAKARPLSTLDEMIARAARLDAVATKEVARFQPCVARCTGERCLGQFSLTGTLVAQDGHGKLSEAVVEPDYSIQNPFVASCVLDVLSGLTFPKPEPTSPESVHFGFTVSEWQGKVVINPARHVHADDTPGPTGATVVAGSSPATGAADAPVTLVVFTDFECPFCSKADSTLQRVLAAYPGQVRLVFKQSPLASHPRARLAALASLAAQQQGKFWPYEGALFGRTDALDRDSLLALAREQGLDVPRFTQALDSPALAATLDGELEEARRAGVRATPTTFVNGTPLEGALPFESFTQAIDAELARSGHR